MSSLRESGVQRGAEQNDFSGQACIRRLFGYGWRGAVEILSTVPTVDLACLDLAKPNK